MALSTTQYGYIIDPMVPFTDDKGKTIKDGFVRVFVAGSSTPVVTYRNFDGATNQDRIELDNSGRTKTSVIGSKGLTYKVCVYDKHHSLESPILTVDKVSVIGANITAGTGATVVTGLDGLTTKPNGFVDASVIGTDGYVALDHTLVEDDLDTDAKVTAVENDRYIPLLNEDVNDPDSKMTLGRLWQWDLGKIKSLPTTITTFRTGDVIPVDGPSGTAKMAKDDLLKETAQNALANKVVPDFDDTKAYSVGEVCSYGGEVFLFVKPKPAGSFDLLYIQRVNTSELIAWDNYKHEVPTATFNYVIEHSAGDTWVSSSTIESLSAVIPDGATKFLIKTDSVCNVYFLTDIDYTTSAPDFATGTYYIHLNKEFRLIDVPTDAKYISVVHAKTDTDPIIMSDVPSDPNHFMVAFGSSSNPIHYDFKQNGLYFIRIKTYHNYGGNGVFTRQGPTSSYPIIDENIAKMSSTSIGITGKGYRFSYEPTKDVGYMFMAGATALCELYVNECDQSLPTLFIVDTDFGGDCDDAMAMRVLAQAEKMGKIEIVGVNCSIQYTNSVEGMDGLLCYEGITDMPIGVDTQHQASSPSTYLGVCANYPHNMVESDADDSLTFYRKLLTWIPENRKVILLTLGGYSSVSRACDDTDVLELMNEKLTKVWMMGGNLNHPSWGEYNFMEDYTKTNNFLQKCPVRMYISPSDACLFVMGGAILGELGMSWDLVQQCIAEFKHAAYTDVLTRESPDPVTAMFAIADNAEIYNARLQRFSSITVNSSGQSTITESDTNGKWYYLIPKVFTREKGAGLYNLALAHKLNELLAMRKEGFENKVTRMPR